MNICIVFFYPHLNSYTGKTTHIATLMQDQGTVFALDRNESKAVKVRQLAEKLGISCIRAEGWDSTSCVDHEGCPMEREGTFSPYIFVFLTFSGV